MRVTMMRRTGRRLNSRRVIEHRRAILVTRGCAQRKTRLPLSFSFRIDLSFSLPSSHSLLPFSVISSIVSLPVHRRTRTQMRWRPFPKPISFSFSFSLLSFILPIPFSLAFSLFAFPLSFSFPLPLPPLSFPRRIPITRSSPTTSRIDRHPHPRTGTKPSLRRRRRRHTRP